MQDDVARDQAIEAAQKELTAAVRNLARAEERYKKATDDLYALFPQDPTDVMAKSVEAEILYDPPIKPFEPKHERSPMDMPTVPDWLRFTRNIEATFPSAPPKDHLD